MKCRLWAAGNTHSALFIAWDQGLFTSQRRKALSTEIGSKFIAFGQRSPTDRSGVRRFGTETLSLFRVVSQPVDGGLPKDFERLASTSVKSP